jgi:hypothetical protein
LTHFSSIVRILYFLSLRDCRNTIKEMRDLPISALISFPPPNYTNPVVRDPALFIINGIFISIVITVVALRIYTRLFIKRWIGSDDIFIMIATVRLISITLNKQISIVQGLKHYSGIHDRFDHCGHIGEFEISLVCNGSFDRSCCLKRIFLIVCSIRNRHIW